MARPVKWARDMHTIRDKAVRSRTETWSRQDLEHLFDIGRASSQTLMKAIGGIQTVGGTHFIDRTSLLGFLDAMLAAESVEAGLQAKLLEATPPPKVKPLRMNLPADLRNAMLADLPASIILEPGRLEVRGVSSSAIVECLMTLALIMQNDLDSVMARLEHPSQPREDPTMDQDLREMLRSLRKPSPPQPSSL